MKFSKEFAVGLLTIVAFVLLYFGFNFLKGQDFFSTRSTYYAFYDNIDGLKSSNEILLNGVAVGQVAGITILQDRGGKVMLTLEVDDNISLYQNTKATITSDLLGSKSILLDMGEPSAVRMDGDTIEGYAEKGFAEMIQAEGASLTGGIEETILRMNSILAEFQGNGEKINEIVENLQSITKQTDLTIKENRNHLHGTTTEVEKLLTGLNDPEQGLQATMSEFRYLADSLSQINVQPTLAKLNATLDNLNSTLDLVQNGDGLITRALKDDSVYNSLNQVMVDLDKLFIDLKDNPKRYVHFSLFGKKDKSKK